MVHPSQRGQALIEVIATIALLLTFAFLYFSFSQATLKLIEKDRFEERR